jgi:hypothetical protein
VLIKFYRKWRLIPALDAQGRPTPGLLRVSYEQPKKGPARTKFDAPADANADKDRVRRMTCRDFAWEYQYMQQIAGKLPVDNEPPLRAAFALYLEGHPKKGDDLRRLCVKECTARPTQKFWSGVYEPKLDRHFAKGSRPEREWPPKKKPKSAD